MNSFCAFALLLLQKHHSAVLSQALLSPWWGHVSVHTHTHTVSDSKTALESPEMLLGPLPGPFAPLSPSLLWTEQPGTHRAAKHLHGLERHLLPSDKGYGSFPATFAKVPRAHATAPSPAHAAPSPLSSSLLPPLRSPLLLCLCVGVFGNEIIPAELQNEMQRSQLLE